MTTPRTRCGGEWTEARYWQFIRTLLRQGSIRFPSRKQAMNAARRPSQTANPRQKREYHCAECGNWFMGKNVVVDHITPAGKMTAADDLIGYVERLFCEPDQLRVVCKVCHDRKTYQRGRS